MANSDFTAKLGNAADPIERLTWHYEKPAAEAMASAANGIPVVGITSNTVPWELIRAAGAFPCVINSGNAHHRQTAPRSEIRWVIAAPAATSRTRSRPSTGIGVDGTEEPADPCPEHPLTLQSLG